MGAVENFLFWNAVHSWPSSARTICPFLGSDDRAQFRLRARSWIAQQPAHGPLDARTPPGLGLPVRHHRGSTRRLFGRAPWSRHFRTAPNARPI